MTKIVNLGTATTHFVSQSSHGCPPSIPADHAWSDIHNHPDDTWIPLPTIDSHPLRMIGHTQPNRWHPHATARHRFPHLTHGGTYTTQQMTPSHGCPPSILANHAWSDIHNYPDDTRQHHNTRPSTTPRVPRHTQLPRYRPHTAVHQAFPPITHVWTYTTTQLHTIQRTPEVYRPTEHAKTYITQQISPGFGRQPQIPTRYA